VTTVRPAVRLAEMTDQPIDVAAVERLVSDPRAGAVVTFTGAVRDHDHGRPVAGIEYVGHPSADDVLGAVAAEIAALPTVIAVAVRHRVGHLAVGDIAVITTVSCAHRGDAFEACGRLIDTVKSTLPVWKRQVFADGGDEWVACP
jgi:molybdopterin synthase catalytic subunit